MVAARRVQNRIAAIILLLFTAIALWYAAAIPVGEGVDEIPHFLYVLYLKEQRALPIQPKAIEEGVDVWMGHHPPLYYAFGAAVVSLLDTSDAEESFPTNPHFVWRENDGRNGWNVVQHYGQDTLPGQGAVFGLRALRLANIVLSVAALAALLLAGRMIFGASSWLPIGIVAFIAFNPSYIFMTATVHHDVMQSALFAFGILWLVYLLKKDDVPRVFYILGGILVAAAMLTKLSGAALALTTALVLLVRAYPWSSWRRTLMPFLLTFGTAILLAGWWYIRNWALYGDPLGWEMFLTIHQHMIRQKAYSLAAFYSGFLGQVSRTFWGAFGYMHITFPKLARAFTLATGVALIGFVLALVRGRLQLRRNWKVWLLLATVLGSLFASFVRFSMATVGAGHARYLFPALFVIGVVVVIGLNELTAWRFPRGVSLALAIGMAGYSIWLPLTLVLPKYAPPETMPLSELPAEAETVNLALGESLILAAYDIQLATTHVGPGQSIPVTLYWRTKGDGPAAGDEKYVLALLNENDVLMSHSDWPVPTLAPAKWQANTLYLSRAVIEAPEEDYPAPMQIVVSTAETEPAIWLESAVALATYYSTSDTVSVNLEEIANPQDVVFGGQLALRGFYLAPADFTAGAVLPVQLLWQAVERPQAEFTVFVHVMDEQGNLVAQCDRPLSGSSLPVTQWTGEELYSQLCPIEIPSDLTTGEYSLRMGLYTWPSLERHPISSGKSDSPDSFLLATMNLALQD